MRPSKHYPRRAKRIPARFILAALILATTGIRAQIPWETIGVASDTHFPRFTRPVKVAIIDDAFDIDNPAWSASIAHNTREIPDNDLDDDHNGKVDDYEGWDFGDNDNQVRPSKKLLEKESHGTRVLGVFWEVLQRLSTGHPENISILPIKAVSDAKMNNYLKEGYRGIEYAIEQHADVIICSWSGPTIAEEEKAILAKARARGILVIAAAGNFYAMQPVYPGAIPWVIDVAAVDASGKKLRFSNYGMFVDISAPGDSLLTYDPYKPTASAHLSATSAATPVVAAVVTAIRAAYPTLSPDAIERLLKNTATPLEAINPLFAGNLGAGMINVESILNALEGPRNSASQGQQKSEDQRKNEDQRKGDGQQNNRILRQAKAYLDLQHLTTTTPLRIAPYGQYQQIRFLLQPAGLNTAGIPDIRARCYTGGEPHDTLVRGDHLKYPLILKGDSIDFYRASDRAQVSSHSRSWLYYEVITIDSSILYCGGTPTEITGTDGYIEDGSGDQNYTGRNDCKWQLTVPAGKKIRLSFDAFDTEPKLDQVYIFSGTSTKDPILAIFSGHKLPPSITSWDNKVLIWFLTSEENNFPGWRLHFKAVD